MRFHLGVVTAPFLDEDAGSRQRVEGLAVE